MIDRNCAMAVPTVQRMLGIYRSLSVSNDLFLRQSSSLFASSSRPFSSKETPKGNPNESPGRVPVTYLSLTLTLATGLGLYYWYERQRERKLQTLTSRGTVVGQAAIGGPFSLVEASSRKPFTEKDLEGRFSLLYFGFTHCPDICPEELEKVAEAVNLVNSATGFDKDALGTVPVFITVDPERDGPAQVDAYVKEFHPKMVGLTGTPDNVKKAARAYRVYYTRASLGSADAEPKGKNWDDDYLIDHSIITYLIDPEGTFVTFYGRNYTAEEMAGSVAGYVQAWKKAHPTWEPIGRGRMV